MKKALALFFVILFLTSCARTLGYPSINAPAISQTPTPTESPDSLPTITPPQSLQTAPPIPIGTWEMTIEGAIFDQSTGKPIPGAVISYLVVHSYFPEIQEGKPNATTSNEHGKFRLPMVVHDTDIIKLRVEAGTYKSHEEKLDLFGNRSFKIELVPLTTATPSSS